MFAPFLLVLGIELFFNTLDKRIEETKQHEKETKVGEVALAVRAREDVLKEYANFHFFN